MTENAYESVAPQEGLNGGVAATDRSGIVEERGEERQSELEPERKPQSSRENARMKMRRLEGEVRRSRAALAAMKEEQPAEWSGEGARALRQLARLSRENALWREQARQRLFEDDLRQISAAYPGEQAGDVRELGEDFIRLRAAGVGALSAYAAVREAEGRRRAGPPSTGAAGSDQPGEPAYYSSRELDELSERELDDPDVFDRAIRSMRKLSRNTLNRRK